MHCALLTHALFICVAYPYELGAVLVPWEAFEAAEGWGGGGGGGWLLWHERAREMRAWSWSLGLGEIRGGQK